MSQLGYTFDATQVNPQGDRSPVPEGEYNVVLKSTEVKPTPDNTGKYIAGQWLITDGPQKDRTLFNNINLINKNEVAQRIGQERLSALCHVTGRLQINDTAQLHGIPHRVKVSVTSDNKYNEITGFLYADGRSIGGAMPAGHTAPAAAPAWAQPSQPQAPAPAPMPAPAQAPAPQPQYQPAQQPQYPTAPAPAPQPQYQPQPQPTPPAAPAGMPALPPWMQQQPAPPAQ